MPRCPYCKSIHASDTGLQEHLLPCRRRWIKRRGLERKKAGKPPLSDAEKRVLVEQNVFKGFMEDDK